MTDKKNRKLSQEIFLLATALILGGCMPPGPCALWDGKKLIEAGRYDKAVERLQVATSLLATNAQAWNYLGLAYHHAGRFTNAVPAYQQAFKLDHNLTEAHFNLGCLWLEENKLDDAKIEFNAVTLRRPNSADGWMKLGETQLRLRDTSGAEKSYKETLRINPQQAEALNGLGLVAMRRNRATEAAQWFTAALKAQPSYPAALLNFAVVEDAYLGDRQLALQKYREYLALKPAPPNAEAVAVTVASLEKQLAPPRPALTETPPLAPRNESPKLASNPIVAVSQPKAESPIVAPKVANAPRPAPAPVERVTLQPVLKTEPPPTATPEIVSTPEISPEQAAPPPKKGFFERINPFHSRDQKNQSITPLPPHTNLAAMTNTKVGSTVSSVVENTSRFPRYKFHSPNPVTGDHSAAESLFAKGLEAHRENKFSDAARFYLQAVKLDPAYFEAQYNLGLAAMASRNLDQSLLAYENCLALKPDSVDARYNFALALKSANYPVDAANELEKILAENPREIKAHLAAGNLYVEQLREPAMAREHYSKVLEYDPKNSQATAIRYWMISNPSQE